MKTASFLKDHYDLSRKTAVSIGETMELLADPNAMSAIRKHREGAAVYHDVNALDEL